MNTPNTEQYKFYHYDNGGFQNIVYVFNLSTVVPLDDPTTPDIDESLMDISVENQSEMLMKQLLEAGMGANLPDGNRVVHTLLGRALRDGTLRAQDWGKSVSIVLCQYGDVALRGVPTIALKSAIDNKLLPIPVREITVAELKEIQLYEEDVEEVV